MNLSPKKTRLPKAANGMQRVRPRTDDQEPDAGMGAVQGIGGLVATGAAVLDAGRKPISDGQGSVVPEGGSAAGILGSTASGAATGAAAGPLGALAGGVIGAGIGVINYSQAEKDHAAGLRRKELFAQQRNRSNVGLDVASISQASQYKAGVKKLGKPKPMPDMEKPSRAAAQDATAPGSMYKSSPSDGKGGAATLRRTAKGATAILGLAKAIPTPFTQGIGWLASGAGALMDGQDAYDAAKKGDYKGAALNIGQAALQMMPLKTRALTVANKPYNTLARIATIGSLAGDAQDIAAAAGKELKNGSKAVHTKAIEIEGGEPHFSKKTGGKRTLKQYHPHGPKHSQGGIPTIAAEGDAIVTAKGGKGPAAVAAHQRGDHATVEKLINQMPADKGTPKAARGKRRITAPVAPLTSVQSKLLMPQDSLLPGTLSPVAVAPTAKSTLRTDGEQRMSSIGNTALGALQAAPTLYNLGQGLFGNVEKTTRRGYSPELQTYQDLSGPQRQASQQAMNSQISNARNLSGGSAGNVRANANAAFAENATRQGTIDAQESARRLAVGNQNVDSRNQAQVMNIQMNSQADVYDLQNAAKKQEALSKGLEGISGLAGNALLTKNTIAKEGADRAMLSEAYKNYTIDPVTGKPVLRKLRKGMKALKLKNC